MKKLLLLPIIVLLSLFVINYVSADIYYTDAHGIVAGAGSSSEAKYVGANVTFNDTMIEVLNITLLSGDLSSRGYLLNSTFSILANVSCSSEVCVVNKNVTGNGTYYVFADSLGASRTMAYVDGTGIVPVKGRYMNWTRGIFCSNIGTGACTGTTGGDDYIRSIKSIGFRKITVTAINVTITIIDAFDSSSITNFSAEIGGTNYTTTTGTITTNILNNATTLYNVTFFNAKNSQGFYFNRTVNNQNVSGGSISAGLSQTDIKILAYEKITGNERTGSFWTSQGLKNYNTTIPFKAGSYNVTWLNASYSSVYNKTQEFTFTALQNTTVNISGIYNQVLNFTAKDILNNATITNFTITLNDTLNSFSETQSTTNGTMSFFVLQNLNYTAFLNSTLYAVGNTTNYDNINTTATQYNKTFYIYQTNSINIIFKDQSTGTTINWSTITFEALGSYNSYNYTTSNGTLFASFLTPDEYTARYRANGYTERFYIFTVTNQTTQSLTLYLLNSSLASNITLNVIDQSTLSLEDAEITIMKYDIASNSYKTVEITTTNFEGEAYATLTLYNEYYKFIIEYDGEIVFTSTPTYITKDELTFQVIVGNEVLSDYEQKTQINGGITYNNQTQLFLFTFSDDNNLDQYYCLKLYKISNTDTLLNSSCTTTSTGSLNVHYPLINGSTYKAIGSYYDTDTENYEIISIYPLTLPDNIQATTRETGLFFQIVILLIIILLLVYSSPYLLPLGIGLGLIFGRILELNAFNYETLFGFTLVMIILSWWLGRND